MNFKVSIHTIFTCPLERAFKTPMLCDVTKVHTGFGIMPKVTHTTDDADWGKPGSRKKIFGAKALTFKGGEASSDTVVERIENKYWKIEVGDFKTWMLGFYKFTGEWKTTELEKGKILINYTYTLHAQNPLLYPANWLFAHTYWRIYMKRVMENVRKMAYHNEPYLYN